MKTLSGCCAFSIGVVALLLGGCGSTRGPSSASGVVPQVHRGAIPGYHDRPWMLREAASANLLYITDYGSGVMVYSYRPSRLKLVGVLATPQYGEGECVDKAQNVFITSSTDQIFEYAHGGTEPIALLTDSFADPWSCSVDPTTGDLAVVGYPDHFANYGVAIFKKARGKPTYYEDGDIPINACTYDDKGDLFVDGELTSGNAVLAELPSGGSGFTTIPLNQSFRGIGGVQWDGRYVAVGDYYGAVIYEFKIEGSQAKEVGTTPLEGTATDAFQFFIDRVRARVIVPSTQDNASGFVKIYDYPAGGEANRTLDFDTPVGVAVSRDR